jgi:hypothetical protein
VRVEAFEERGSVSCHRGPAHVVADVKLLTQWTIRDSGCLFDDLVIVIDTHQLLIYECTKRYLRCPRVANIRFKVKNECPQW